MRKHLILVKLGGSVATDKSIPLTARPEQIRSFAEDLQDAYRHLPEVDFIVGNGGGSYAHFTAHQYGLDKGAQTPKQRYGMCITHNSVRYLNNLIASEISGQGVPVFALSPAGLIVCDQGKVISANFESIKGLLLQRCVPLLHGDTIVDKTLGVCIKSTEEVLQVCLQRFRSDYEKITVVYLLETAGVLDADGRVITELGPEDAISDHGGHEHDVTGGIKSKIASARKAAKTADQVYLAGGAEYPLLRRLAIGESIGTKISN